jgi:hypothetical protein
MQRRRSTGRTRAFGRNSPWLPRSFVVRTAGLQTLQLCISVIIPDNSFIFRLMFLSVTVAGASCLLRSLV